MAAPCAEIKFLRFEPTGSPVFSVDGFQFADSSVTEHYFLSHFHSDHTVGLTKSFAEGVIYCSPITARLVKEFIQVDPARVKEIPLEEPVEVAGVRVTLVDANHCPGAVVFLFHHLASGRTVVHTGDVRAAECVRSALQGQLQRQGLGAVHELFLDTTYAAGRWDLPHQPEVLEALAALCAEEVKKQPRTLFVVGSYQIGKERAAAAIGRAVGSSVWAASRRFQMLEACEWAQERVTASDGSSKLLFTTDSVGCNVRMENMMALNHERLLSTLEHAKGGFETVCAFRPTGWTFSKTWRKFRPWVENNGRTKVFSIPYSEHSSVSELRALVAALRPQKVIPTVNIERTHKMIDMFAAGMDLSADRERMDWYLAGGSRTQGEEQQLVDVLQLSGGCVAPAPRGPAPLAVADGAVVASPILLSDDEGCGGASSSSSGAAHVIAPAPNSEDLTCVDVAEQQRLLAFYSKQVAARSSAVKPALKAPFGSKAPGGGKAPSGGKGKGKGKGKGAGKGKRKADGPPEEQLEPKKARPRQPRPAKQEPGVGTEDGRGKRFIPKPSAQVRERIDRAFSHRMYLLAARPEPLGAPEGPSAHLDVLGSTGNVYTVTLGRPCQSCTCADHAKQPNRVCKHILFVMLRVCKLPQNDPRVWQAALTPSEARPLVEGLPSREELASQGDGVLASESVLRGFDRARGDGEASQVQQRPISEEPDCPICFEPLAGAGEESGGSSSSNAASWCRSCGHNAHRDCIERWHKAMRGSSCPLCRGSWGPTAAAEASSASAPLNLASLAGAPAPSLEELYPETHQWIGFRRRQPTADARRPSAGGGRPPRAGAAGHHWTAQGRQLHDGSQEQRLSQEPSQRGAEEEAEEQQPSQEPSQREEGGEEGDDDEEELLVEREARQEESQPLRERRLPPETQQPQPPPPSRSPQSPQPAVAPLGAPADEADAGAGAARVQAGAAAVDAALAAFTPQPQSIGKKTPVWPRGRLAIATPSRAPFPGGLGSAGGVHGTQTDAGLGCMVVDLG